MEQMSCNPSVEDEYIDYDDSLTSMEEVVSFIIFNSCRPKSFRWELFTDFMTGWAMNCGSFAEFGIETVQKCVGDKDVFYYHSGKIAFFGEVPMLPFDVRNRDEEIDFYRLEPYQKYPVFVRVKHVGQMKYNWNLNKFEFYEACDTTLYSGEKYIQRSVDIFSTHKDTFDLQVKGPAVSWSCCADNSQDNVFPICCPQWPTEAEDWFHRPRNYGWPTKANLQMIANTGCQVVYAQHRDCRDDKYQWRYSFSLAELVLLKSWTKTQQVVYHMFRFFAKKELIQKECPKEKEVLCTYHLKTLMLWTCEQESTEWWNFFAMGLCFKLLHKLSEWLQRRHCPNYFIPEANLFHEKFDQDIYQAILERIQSFSNPEILSQWFLYNYLLPVYPKKCLTAYGSYDGSLTDLCTIARNTALVNTFAFVPEFEEEFCFMTSFSASKFNEMEILQQMEQGTYDRKKDSIVGHRMLMKSQKSTTYLISLIHMLRAANVIKCKKVFCYKTFLSDMITLLLRRLTSYWPKCNNFPVNYETHLHEEHVYFLRAQEYMGEMPVSVSDPEFQLLSRLSMEFFKKSLSGTDETSKDIRSAAFAYIAAICYVTSQYEIAIELCSAVLTNPEPFDSSRLSTSKREPLSAGCMIFIDDVSNIIGYLLLCRHVLDTLLDRHSEINLDLRLTPEVFAQYIMIQSMQRMSRQLEINWNKIPAKFLMDALLVRVTKRNLTDIKNEAENRRRGCRLCTYRRSSSVDELINHVRGCSLNEDIVIRLLMECSLKKMTSLHDDAFGDIFFPFYNLAFYYRVVYHYTCHDYDKVMTLCKHILCEQDIGAKLKECPFLNVLVLSPFSSYFDNEMQCLIGLQTLFLVLFPLGKYGLHVDEFKGEISLWRNILHCRNIRCLYLLGRHFLARYLQLRCLFDTNSSMSEVVTAFDKLKCTLSFEYIVHEFLWQKLKKTVKLPERL